MGFQTFEDIEAWQEAHALVRLIRQFARRAIEKKDWAWADQISRAALSIMANIAEGNDAQTNAEFVVFLGYAKRSSAEVRSHLYYGFNENYLNQLEFDQTSEQTKKIAAQLAKLITYLRSHSRHHRNPSSSNQPTNNEQRNRTHVTPNTFTNS
ncbi:MAG: four helix bundle protein [Candidatus Peregrinibacteria bacterium]